MSSLSRQLLRVGCPNLPGPKRPGLTREFWTFETCPKLPSLSKQSSLTLLKWNYICSDNLVKNLFMKYSINSTYINRDLNKSEIFLVRKLVKNISYISKWIACKSVCNFISGSMWKPQCMSFLQALSSISTQDWNVR